MPTALPRNIQLKLEQTLAQWPHWHCEPRLTAVPDVAAVLSPGASNFSILVGSGQRFVVRIDGVNPAANGLNRQTEWRALQAAHGAGLAPRPRYFNPDLGSLVCDYLPPDEEQSVVITELAGLLRAIHQLPARHNRLDLAERILRYEKQLQHRGRAPAPPLAHCREQVWDLLRSIDPEAQATALCHNDLLQANRIYSGGRLWAIDWEYCAMGDPWYDIAVVINGDGLNRAQTDQLLDTYLGRAVSTTERQALHHYGCIYRYLELLWYLAQERCPVAGETLAVKQDELAQCLAREG